MIDTWIISSLKEFLDRKAESVAKGGLWRKINDSTYLVTSPEKPRIKLIRLRWNVNFGETYWSDSK